LRAFFISSVWFHRTDSIMKYFHVFHPLGS